MADKVPANIDGQQPAALSDGEFVVPADVVSHLGNGNSNAGVMQLYAMMDNVRKARTGNPKQGKQINPAQYMPGMRA
jgi:predicted amidohydrolase